jgi:hypothetical protein
VARIGESFRLFLEPQTLADLLTSTGFKRYEDLGANEINSRYFANRQDGLGIAQFSRPAIERRILVKAATLSLVYRFFW